MKGATSTLHAHDDFSKNQVYSLPTHLLAIWWHSNWLCWYGWVSDGWISDADPNDKLPNAGCAKFIQHAGVVPRIGIAIIAWLIWSWSAWLTECIITCLSQNTTVSLCASIIVSAWSTSCWRPSAEREVTIVREDTDIPRGARIVIIAWVSGGWCALTEDPNKSRVAGRIGSASIILSASVEIITRSIGCGCPLAKYIVAGWRIDTRVCVGALVVVSAR
jgi:hypothetical protein